MPKITFLPMNLVCDAKDGESILDVAITHDVPLQHACGGFCACTTCHVHVQSGAEFLTAKEDDEEDRMDHHGAVTLRSRLGCQAKIQGGDVVVEIINQGY